MASKKKPKELRKVYQIKVTLEDIRPPIWRRLEVLSDTTLEKLHLILQVAMGWADYHLHQFTIDGIEYGQPDPDYGSEVEDERKVKLIQVAPEENAKFIYEYDFGDSWQHTILIEKILPVERGKHYPICVKGKWACPPEDIGGPWGYTDFIEAVLEPSHPEHEDMLEWIGGKFDPEALNIDEINENLKQIR